MKQIWKREKWNKKKKQEEKQELKLETPKAILRLTMWFTFAVFFM